MNRRSFIGLFAASAASVGIGISPIVAAALPPTVKYSMRYIEAFDVMKGRMVYRIDLAKGIPLTVPKSINRGLVFENVGHGQVIAVCRKMRESVPEMPDPSMVANLLQTYLEKNHDMFGVTWS
jgi:hypothetical protein